MKTKSEEDKCVVANVQMGKPVVVSKNQTLHKIVENTFLMFKNIMGINHKKLTQENTKVNVFGQKGIKFTEAEEEA